MATFSSLVSQTHRFDITLDAPSVQFGGIDLLVEELPETLYFASDCASTAASVSTASTAGCGSIASAGSIGTMGSITSSGG
ncbi:hypothetical protein [Pantoea sp. CCBC3-3-1]|uniref:hypothetical protein n=1 Tax=Pantoea sp. CCBC3-3-1 TaxID=2490851 RepID=UPI0011BDA365|nr:hypothetical protein [Pantoea sp. CCBC3-3-1]